MQQKVVLIGRVKHPNGKFGFAPIVLKRGRPSAPANTTTYYLRYSRAGRRVVEPVGSNLEVAFTAYQNHELELARNKQGLLSLGGVNRYTPETPAAHSTPLRDAIENYLQASRAIGNADDTIGSKTRILHSFLQVAAKNGVTTVEAVGREALLAYMSWMKANLRTVELDGARRENTYHTRMRRVGAFLKQHGIKIKKDMNPGPADPGLLAHHEFPKSKAKKPTKYSKETVRVWLKAATTDEADLIWFFLATGFRDEEVAHVEWSDINFRDRTINIHEKPRTAKRKWKWKPKDDESRPFDIPLSMDLIQRMENRRSRVVHTDCALVFPNKACRPDMNLLRIVRRAAKRAGIAERISLHTIRKTFACYIAENHPIELVRQLLGHSDIKTTQMYLAADAADVHNMQTSIDKMSATFGG